MALPWFFLAAVAAGQAPPGVSSDLEALIAFKALVADPLGVLGSNWTANTSLCSWVGVSCGRRHPERVVVLTPSGVHLQGSISPAVGNGAGTEDVETIDEELATDPDTLIVLMLTILKPRGDVLAQENEACV